MFGSWHIKKGAYVGVANQAKALLQQFTHIRGTWVPRERNAVADGLSKAELVRAGMGVGGCFVSQN